MMNPFREAIEDSPVIAAVKNDNGLKKCLESDAGVVFILYGDACSIGKIVEKVHAHGKIAMVHLDLVNGLSAREAAIDFIKEFTEADGIITTRQNLMKYAKEKGLYTVLRFFVIDSMALVNIENLKKGTYPDVVEILPGLMPKIIKKVSKISPVPVIAGGLISDKEDVMQALEAGAVSISSTCEDVWFM